MISTVKTLQTILLLIVLAAAPFRASAETELIVSAASSLTNAMKKVVREFEHSHPDIKVVLNFASSGALLQQMIHGAPVDVFASASQRYMDAAQEKALILPETRKNFASNRLVIAVPSDSPLAIDSMKALASGAVQRISLGNPAHVPAGRYARQSLESHGLWDKLADKYVYANTVRQVLDYIRRGEVDAGLVYATDPPVAGKNVKIALQADGHEPIVYPIGVLSATTKPEAAVQFVEFVCGKRGLRALSTFGFQSP